MRLLRIFTCVFAISLLASLSLSAQNRQQESELTENDTIPLYRGIAVSYNAAGTIMRAVSDYGEFEGAVRVNLRDKYFPLLEFGLGDAKHNEDPNTNVTTKTSAPFFRLGCDFNVAKNKHDDYRVFFGGRYGFSSFKQKASGDVIDPYWGGTLPYLAESSCTYHWAELVFSVDAKIAGPVRLGWSFRYKQKLASSSDDGMDIWYAPGFGKSGNVLGGTFNVTVEL